MATKKYEMGLVIVLALMLCRGATAQSSCSSSLMSLPTCISYVTGNSSTPSSSCCASLASIVSSQPQCLCPLLNSGAGSSLGIAFNQTLALALPAACKVQTPPVSQCNDVANGPARVPAPSPPSPPTYASTEPPRSPTATMPASIPSGSKTVPKTSGSASDGSTVKLSIYLTVVTLFIAAWIANTFHF